MATQYGPTSVEGPDAASAPHAEGSETIIGLLRRLTDQLSTLFRQELALAVAEISRSFSTFAAGAASVAASGAVLFAALLLLLASAVLGLSNVMSPWLAALAVGVVVGIVGYIMLHAGLKKMKPSALKPTRTTESLKRDKDLLMRKQ